jgi:uncharacterized protein YggE
MTQRTITTDATAKRESQPDIASIEIEAVGEGASPEVAHVDARDRAATVLESLKETDISENQIHTDKVRVEDTSDMFIEAETSAAYQSVEEIQVNCAPEATSEVFEVATKAGGKVSRVRYKLHEEVRHRLLEEAASAALEKARKKAESLASTEGLELAGVQEVTTTDTDIGMSGLDEGFVCEEVDLCPAPISVSETVKATYEVQ